MEEKDFRIGNWVLENGSYRQIEADDFYNPQLLNPIPLTEEILLKCGFELQNEFLKYSNGYFELVFNDERVSLLVEGQWLSLEIIYLHQLQNIYFSLTNKELEINL